jgi:hypothetical protein
MIALFTLLAALTAHAGFGTKLEPQMKPDGGHALGISYAYDVDRSWTFNYTSNISRAALAGAPLNLRWNLVHKSSNQDLQEWTPATRHDLELGTLAVQAVKPLFQLLPEMKSYALVFADTAGKPLFYFDIGELCDLYPQNIRDLSNTANKACEVDKSQLPDVENECKERRSYFEDMLKKGLLNCKLANEQLAKKGCEPIRCK